MIEVRPLRGLEEIGEAVRLQQAVWGFEEVDLIPARMFVVAMEVGGQAFGAFDGARMIGFCVGIPGVQRGHAYLHSHMLGVLEEYRNSGVGRRLKLAQRDDALSKGIGLIEWTFDPLEIKNAYFNIERLGVIVRRYALNQYGITTSPLQGGLPTDRCVAEWWLQSPRVQALLAGKPLERPPAAARVAVPVAIESLKRTDPRQAREVQKRVSGEFLEHLSRGLEVTGLERTPVAGVYLLSKWESE